jgi:hypothetical protein
MLPEFAQNDDPILRDNASTKQNDDGNNHHNEYHQALLFTKFSLDFNIHDRCAKLRFEFVKQLDVFRIVSRLIRQTMLDFFH